MEPRLSELTQAIRKPVTISSAKGRLAARYLRCLGAGKTYAQVQTAKEYGDSVLEEALSQLHFEQKAAVDAIATADMVGALGTVGADFAEFLRPQTIIGRLQGTVQAPFLTRLLSGAVGTAASWVDENKPIPVSAASIDAAVSLPIRKVGTIALTTQELLRVSTPSSEPLLLRDVSAAIVARMDASFVDPGQSGTGGAPASITNGAPTFASAGSSLSSIDADLARLLDSVTSGGSTLATGYWLMRQKTANYLALLRGTGGAPAYPGMNARGGVLLGLPVLVSNGCELDDSPTSGVVVLVDAGSVLVADEGGSELSIAEYAAVQMDSAPDDPGTASTVLVSLWQQNLVGVKAVRYVSWLRRHDTAVASLTSVTY